MFAPQRFHRCAQPDDAGLAAATALSEPGVTVEVVERGRRGRSAGSVVETRATPVGAGTDGRPRTAVLEAVVAHSARPGFVHALRGVRLIRPVMRRAVARLRRDDLAYAERLYHVRTR